eukprot:TRINITY_DN62903_c0_g1_i1.p1 TRINITY_DN62903_c0_g1~~TRINITY_DN62903_c0_g1_i1.p1  ORF type:complete len:129 (-),score=31.52 TRINITY_DN62903_c0_g1_i1:79-465(-)
MEFLNKSNTDLISSDVIVTEKIFNNETVNENILLGVFFISLSLSMFPMMAKNHQTPQKIAKSANIKTFLQSLPFNGISKLVMTGISIILTVIISSANEMETKSLQCILHVTIYISFSISVRHSHLLQS